MAIPSVGLACPLKADRAPYEQALRRAGAEPVHLKIDGPFPAHITGLLLAGPDRASTPDRAGMAAIEFLGRPAAEGGLPVLGIGWGMYALNVILGGLPGSAASAHGAESAGQDGFKRRVFISPGSKLAHILGGSGHVAIAGEREHTLNEPHRAPQVLAAAYCIEDGAIEAIEQPGRAWALGVQWPVHLPQGLPARFDSVFVAFVERATEIAQGLP